MSSTLKKVFIFRPQWLDHKDSDVISEWCKRPSSDSQVLNCVWCNVELNFVSKGIDILKQHAKSDKKKWHKHNRRIILTNFKLTPSNLSRTSLQSTSTQSLASQLSVSQSTQSLASSSDKSPAILVQPPIGLFLRQGTQNLANEIIWAIHMTLKDSPDSEIDRDSKVLRRMAPNDLGTFAMCRTKLKAIWRRRLATGFGKRLSA